MSMSVNVSVPWRLSHILEGHSGDVKSVYASCIDDEVELLHSASRDETSRSWYRRSANDRDTAAAAFQRGSTYQGNRYQNAVAHLISSSSDGNGTTILGGLDASILTFETKSSYSKKPQKKIKQTLRDHYDNVCHLSLYDGTLSKTQTLLISASWDCTSKVWRLNELNDAWHHLHTLKGHERAVWAAEIISAIEGQERYLTASADLFVRLWHGEELTRIFAGHIDVVRAITLLPPQTPSVEPNDSIPPFYDQEALFATASNDGTVRVWSLDDRRVPMNNPTNGGDALRVLQAADSDLLYDIKYAGLIKGGKERIAISCGEDGVLRGWNIEFGQEVFSIPQPVTSIWSLAILPLSGDLVTANSDAKLRIFTQRAIVSNNLDQEQDSIAEVTQAQLQEHEAKCKAIKQQRARRVDARAIVKESTPVDATLSSKEYDQILKIDVSDDSKPLSLGWNRGDDAHQAAKTFIERHSLPTSYEDQIVAFIDQVGLK